VKPLGQARDQKAQLTAILKVDGPHANIRSDKNKGSNGKGNTDSRNSRMTENG
jgi:hypothetical protein